MYDLTFERGVNLDDSQAKAADQSGINRDYWDVSGHRHEISPAPRRKILESLGWSIDDFEALERQRIDAFERDSVYPLLSTAVVSESEKRIPLTLDQSAEGEVSFEVVLEDGQKLSGSLHTSQLPVYRRIHLDHRHWKAYHLPLPAGMPLGYHQLQCSLNGHFLGEGQVIVCPDRAYLPENLANGGLTAGFNVTLYGLRSSRNWGCGDFTDLRALIDWARHDVGFSFIGLNPLHAIHNRAPYNTSPYLPNSIFYKNWIYIDIERVEEFSRCSCAQKLRQSHATEAKLRELRDAEFVQYSQIDRVKRTFLRLLYREFRRSRQAHPERSQAFDRYCDAEGGLLHRFALYCALDQVLHKRDRNVWTWRQWPQDFQDPESESCRRFAGEYARSIEFYKYVQFVLQIQLDKAQQHAREAGMPIGLYHDLAVATDNTGSDLWAYRSFYVPGCRVGSPPDDFSPSGQDWAFPPPNTLAHRADGYRLYSESIRKIAGSGGALRIDHVMRLYRLFWIPDGFGPLDGTYVTDNALDLLRILALESVRSRNIVVGEDLGTVTDEMREGFSQFRILSYRLFWFEKHHASGQFKHGCEYPRQALVASSTHDLPTLAGFWTGRDIDARRIAGLVDEDNYGRQKEERKREKQKILDVLHQEHLLPEHYGRDAGILQEVDGDLHNAVIAFLAQVPSLLLLLNGEDFTKEENQQNLPGSTSEYPNWQRKMKVCIEDLRSPQWQAFSAMFRHQLQRSGRL